MFLIACNTHKNEARIDFKNDEVNFSITKGNSFSATFKFKNTGDDSLQIISANASCGCTKIDYIKEKIAPGTESEIKVNYDSKNESDSIVVKKVLIETNTKPLLHTLTLKGVVKRAIVLNN